MFEVLESLENLSMTDAKEPVSKGLKAADVNQLVNQHVHFRKQRRDSFSHKHAEEKKIPVYCTKKRQRCQFKPSGSRGSFREKENSPMVIDAPLVKISDCRKKVPHGVKDIDSINDPLSCSMYAQDICDYLQTVECRFTFPKNFPHNQKGVTADMRRVLVDWIIQVQVHQRLNQNTLHLCVAIMDRFLTKMVVSISKLQLMGVSALLVASKYHERHPPEIVDLCHLTADTYSSDDVLHMERILLKGLNFDLNVPCPFVFLDRFLMVHTCDQTPIIKSMAMYFLDLSLVEVDFVHFQSSMKAASAIYVTRELLCCDIVWDKSFEHYSKYSEKDLQDCVTAMRKLMAMAVKFPHLGAHTKYANRKYHGVSNYRCFRHIAIHQGALWPGQDDHVEDDDHEDIDHDDYNVETTV